jgi:hypothetical protein
LNGEVSFISANNDVKITLENKDNKYEEKVVNGKYSFQDIMPGDYKITISKVQGYCWEYNSKEISLQSVMSLNIKQIGVQITIISSHKNIDVNISTKNINKNLVLNQGNF